MKIGFDAVRQLLQSGCNDVGGTLMDENISRAAGAAHGQLDAGRLRGSRHSAWTTARATDHALRPGRGTVRRMTAPTARNTFGDGEVDRLISQLVAAVGLDANDDLIRRMIVTALDMDDAKSIGST